MLHVRGAETNQTPEKKREEELFSFTLNFLTYYFIFLENAVSTMFVTNCTLAEPLSNSIELEKFWNEDDQKMSNSDGASWHSSGPVGPVTLLVIIRVWNGTQEY